VDSASATVSGPLMVVTAMFYSLCAASIPRRLR
jgi:hypothetical protein